MSSLGAATDCCHRGSGNGLRMTVEFLYAPFKAPPSGNLSLFERTSRLYHRFGREILSAFFTNQWESGLATNSVVAKNHSLRKPEQLWNE